MASAHMGSPMAKSSQLVLQTHAWAEKHGFKVVALHKQSKAAVGRDYVKTDYQSPSADHWRKYDQGIGIVTGPLHSGPVDFDLDCEEAVFFAPFFLPATSAVFGRASKRRSHYLYKATCTSFDKIAFSDPVTKTTIVEARGDGGHQTCAPGSIHEQTGELIEWDNVAFPDVTDIDVETIQRSVKKIAISTLLVRYAWGAGTHNETTKNLAGLLYYLEWPIEETIQLIEALMAWDDDDDKSRIPTVRATYKRGEAGKKIAGAGVLRKQLNNDPVVDKILEWAGSSTVNLLQEYNDRYAVVSVSGKFRIAETANGPGEPPIFYQKEDWLNLNFTDKMEIIDDKGKSKSVPKAAVWLNSPRRRQYKTVDFLPGDDESTSVLNIWGGWAVEPTKPGRNDSGCTAFLELLSDVICGGDPELNRWMLHWFAHIVREPMKKSLTAPVIIGVEGAGKSLMLAYFGKILGPAYTVVTNEKHIYGQFNSHLATTLLLHSEEALYGGDQRHASIIRSLITDEKRMWEPKGIDARQVKNYLRLILLSNKDRAAPVMPGDRRYTVINMKARKVSDELLARVLAEFDSDGPAALFHYLMTMDYDPVLPRINVKNDDLAQMKAHNFTPLEDWWYGTLQSGQILPDPLNWATIPDGEAWPSVVASPTLYAAMAVDLKDKSTRYVPNDTAFALEMNKMLGMKLQRAQRSFDNQLAGATGMPQMWTKLGNRQYAIINLPDLETCRRAFEAYVGQPLDWPEDEPDKTPAFMKKDSKKDKPHERY